MIVYIEERAGEFRRPLNQGYTRNILQAEAYDRNTGTLRYSLAPQGINVIALNISPDIVVMIEPKTVAAAIVKHYQQRITDLSARLEALEAIVSKEPDASLLWRKYVMKHPERGGK